MQKRMIALAAMAALTASMLMGSLSMAAEENTENIVDTAYGKVQGINHTGDYADVVEFRGIPYAAPPVGDLRWKPPVDPEPWEDVLVCDTYKDIPMQVLPQVFHLDMSGNREAVIVGCESIREYALGCITIGAGKLAVQFCGDALQIRNMNEGTIVIEGEIHTIHFETVEQPTQR